MRLERRAEDQRTELEKELETGAKKRARIPGATTTVANLGALGDKRCNRD